MRSSGRWLVVAGALLSAVAVGLPTALAATAVDSGPGAASVFVVHMSTAGDDRNSGLTPARAVKTLARAQTVIKEANPQVDVEVRIKQGTYVAPPLAWDTLVAGHTVSFMPADYRYGDGDTFAGRPVFNGNGEHGYWISVKLPPGHPGGATNLRFYYLQVEDYSNGLVFEGKLTRNADDVSVPRSAGLNNNTVFGMAFNRIGSRYAPASSGYSAITLQTSSHNLIRNNHFTSIVNKDSEPGILHAIYVAHHSDGNTITSNRFRSIGGDPVRIRNDSNENLVEDNAFERTGRTGFYSEWFCDTACVARNPGHGRECASHGNWFRQNTLAGRRGYEGPPISVVGLTPPGNATAGGTGCTNEGQDRVRTAGNT